MGEQQRQRPRATTFGVNQMQRLSGDLNPPLVQRVKLQLKSATIEASPIIEEGLEPVARHPSVPAPPEAGRPPIALQSTAQFAQCLGAQQKTLLNHPYALLQSSTPDIVTWRGAQDRRAGCHLSEGIPTGARHTNAVMSLAAWPFALADRDASKAPSGFVLCNTPQMAEHYQAPGWFTTNVFNRAVAELTRLGVSVYGSRVLEVKGRKSGEWRQTPVNLLRYDGDEYLVAPRGHTQWVKNLRASGDGRLCLGRHSEPFSAVEVADDDKVPVLRAYLKKWKVEVGVFFDGVGPDSADEELRKIAPDHPVFKLTTT
jgi:deazaflavin-dependent oxidoreductase (nitroreductase family)